MRLRPRAGQALNLAIAVVALALVAGAGTSAAAPRLQLAAAGGALSLSNSRAGAAIFTAAAMRPGAQATGTVRIGNTGTVAGSLSLARTAAPVEAPGTGGGRLSTRLELQVIDVTRSVTVYAGRLAAMPPIPLGRFAPGEQRQYRFVAMLPLVTDNTLQGAQLTTGFTWTAQGVAATTPATTPAPTRTPAPGRPPAAPPPAVTAPPPGVAGPDAALADQVFAMPAPRGCISRRSFPIHIRRPHGVTFTKLTITVNGRAKVRAKGMKARRLKARINLRGLPKGTVVVKVVAHTSAGAKLVSKRSYRTCTTKKVKRKRKQRRR